MAETIRKMYAVVTGSNRGIGFEICKQLASHDGMTVVLTARDEKRGAEAVDKLNSSGLPGTVVFHQLDVTDSESIASFAEFIRSQFGKLDILVNNAGISGSTTHDLDGLIATWKAGGVGGTNWIELLVQDHDLSAACFQTNYYGVKRTTEALLPLLKLSSSPRIVNVSSTMGKLKNIPSESVKGILKGVDSLTEERIDELLDEFLEDLKEGRIESKVWPQALGAYIVSKAAVNAYTQILAKKLPSFRINCVCPGYVKTDFNYNTGVYTVEEGAETPVMAALLPDDGPTGCFFYQKEVASFDE